MTDKYTHEYEFEKNTFNLFNISDYREFLVDNKVIITVVGFVIANNMTKLIDSFFDNIILVCNENKTTEELCDNNKSIIDIIYYFKITIGNYNIYLGRFFISILKFIISITIAFYISRILNDIIN